MINTLFADTIRCERILMRTYAFVIVDGNSADITNVVFDRMKQVEDSLSSFLKEGGVSKLNWQRKGRVNNDLFEVLNLCKKFYSETNGCFD